MGGESGRRSIVVGSVCLALGLGITAYSYISQRSTRRSDTSSFGSQSDAAATNGASSNDNGDTLSADQEGGTASKTVGRQDAGKGTAGQPQANSQAKGDPHFDYGKLPSVKGNANTQVRSVAEALRDKNHPERISPLIQPKFNLDTFRKDPAAYLAVVEPGRCFLTASPGPGTPPLRSLSPQLQNVKQGESVNLRLQTAPKGCVSLTAFDGGIFKENGLNAVTVLADDAGVAEATFEGARGSISECKILAGSPMASGTVRLLVNILEP